MNRRAIEVLAVAVALCSMGVACASAETEDPQTSTGGTNSGGSGGSSGKGSAGVGGGVVAGGSSGGGSGGSSAGGGSGGSSAGGSGGSAGSGATGGAGATGGSGGSLPTNTLLFDDFEDNDAMGWIADVDGEDYVGNWAVVADGANHVYREQTEYSDESWSVGGDLAWTDQRVETKVRFSSSGGEGLAFLAARLSSKERYYFIEFRQAEDNGTLKLRKELDGSTTDLIGSTDTNLVIANGTWYTLALSVKGSTLAMFFNGTMLGMATDADLTNGGIAIGVVDAMADFDDVTVTVP